MTTDDDIRQFEEASASWLNYLSTFEANDPSGNATAAVAGLRKTLAWSFAAIRAHRDAKPENEPPPRP